jgi:hypothetical protein
MRRAFSLVFVSVMFLGAAVAAMAQTNVTGSWTLTVETQGGSGSPTFEFKQAGEELTGTYKGQFGESPLKGTVKGNEIKFTIKIDAQGQALEIQYEGTVDGSTMKGKVKLGELGEGTFTGKKN